MLPLTNHNQVIQRTECTNCVYRGSNGNIVRDPNVQKIATFINYNKRQ